MILQIDGAAEVVTKSFNTNPDTVYGVLVGVLVLVTGVVLWAAWKMVNRHKDERKENKDEIVSLVKDHKNEMKELMVNHEKADTKKYEDMKGLTEKVMVGMEKMTGMIEVLTKK